MTSLRYVIATGISKENALFGKQLKTIGLRTLSLPSIAFKNNLSSVAFSRYIAGIHTYDWVLFTSGNGVAFFMDGLRKAKKNISILQAIRIAAVGEKTAGAIKKYGLDVSFIPSAFATEHVAKEFPEIAGKRILLPRSSIGNPQLNMLLEEKGAIVTDMPLYKTIHQKFDVSKFKKLLQTKQILCITFTSPSTIDGFLKNMTPSLKSSVLSIPVISIGQVTSDAAKKSEFRIIHTARIHTREGMITKIIESIL